MAYLAKFARTSVICAPLCSLVFLETFVRDTMEFVSVVLCDAGCWTDRVFVFLTLAYCQVKVIKEIRKVQK